MSNQVQKAKSPLFPKFLDSFVELFSKLSLKRAKKSKKEVLPANQDGQVILTRGKPGRIAYKRPQRPQNDSTFLDIYAALYATPPHLDGRDVGNYFHQLEATANANVANSAHRQHFDPIAAAQNAHLFNYVGSQQFSNQDAELSNYVGEQQFFNQDAAVPNANNIDEVDGQHVYRVATAQNANIDNAVHEQHSNRVAQDTDSSNIFLNRTAAGNGNRPNLNRVEVPHNSESSNYLDGQQFLNRDAASHNVNSPTVGQEHLNELLEMPKNNITVLQFNIYNCQVSIPQKAKKSTSKKSKSMQPRKEVKILPKMKYTGPCPPLPLNPAQSSTRVSLAKGIPAEPFLATRSRVTGSLPPTSPLSPDQGYFSPATAPSPCCSTQAMSPPQGFTSTSFKAVASASTRQKYRHTSTSSQNSSSSQQFDPDSLILIQEYHSLILKNGVRGLMTAIKDLEDAPLLKLVKEIKLNKDLKLNYTFQDEEDGGNTVFHLAVIHSKLAAFEKILDNKKSRKLIAEALRVKNNMGYTPLHLLAALKDTSLKITQIVCAIRAATSVPLYKMPHLLDILDDFGHLPCQLAADPAVHNPLVNMNLEDNKIPPGGFLCENLHCRSHRGSFCLIPN